MEPQKNSKNNKNTLSHDCRELEKFKVPYPPSHGWDFSVVRSQDIFMAVHLEVIYQDERELSMKLFCNDLFYSAAPARARARERASEAYPPPPSRNKKPALKLARSIFHIAFLKRIPPRYIRRKYRR